MPGRLEFGFNFGGRDAPPRPEDDETPTRLLLLGDFSGRDSVSPDAQAAIAAPRRIDIDNFDTVMARIDPSLDFPGDDTTDAAQVSFHTLEDFHPDRLYARLPLFNALQQLRADLADPSRFASAVARLGGGGAQDGQAPDTPLAPAPTGVASPFDALMGGKPATSGATTATKAAGTIDRLIADAIAPHITPGEDPRQAEYMASADLAISSQMREVLADPAFRRLETAWRGLWWLVSNTEPEAVEIFVLDLGSEALAASLAEPDGPLTQRLLDGRGAGDAPWGMLFGLYEFGADDVALVERLGELAARLGGSFVADADPGLLGGAAWPDCNDPSAVSRAPLVNDDAWRALRTAPAAGHVGLAGPRVLLRLPYGPETDEIDAFDFTELVSAEEHDAYLWGHASIAIALLLARELAEDSGPATGQWLLEDVPAHAYRLDGETHLTPGAECYLGERAAEALLAAGVMPLVSLKNRNAVQVLRLQSIADPATALALAGA